MLHAWFDWACSWTVVESGNTLESVHETNQHWAMDVKFLAHKLSQIYKQCPCSFLLLFVVFHETRYYRPNFLHYRPSSIDLYTLSYIVGGVFLLIKSLPKSIASAKWVLDTHVIMLFMVQIYYMFNVLLSAILVCNISFLCIPLFVYILLYVTLYMFSTVYYHR